MALQLALFAAPPQAARLVNNHCPQTTIGSSKTACPIRLFTMRTISPSTKTVTTLSRRSFGALLTTLPLTLLPNESRAGDLSGLVTPYKDLPKGFTILRPTGWNEFEGLQDAYDIKWQDVIQPLEFITVLTSPLPKEKRLQDIGAASEVGRKLAGGRGGELVKVLEKDIDGIPAYVFEIKKGNSHQITLLSVNKQKLYSVNASCSERRWPRREKLLRGVVDSFKPKL